MACRLHKSRCLRVKTKLDGSEGFQIQNCGNLPHHEFTEQFREFLARVCARAQPTRHTGDSPRGDARWVGATGCCGGATALVVDRAGARCFVCARVALPLLCGAQPASHIRTSVVVLVGGPKDGDADAYRKDGRGSSALHCWKLENAKLQDRNKPTKHGHKTKLKPRLRVTRYGWRGCLCRERGSRRQEAGASRNPARSPHAQRSFPEDSSS